jgi:hypothetical protein
VRLPLTPSPPFGHHQALGTTLPHRNWPEHRRHPLHPVSTAATCTFSFLFDVTHRSPTYLTPQPTGETSGHHRSPRAVLRCQMSPHRLSSATPSMRDLISDPPPRSGCPAYPLRSPHSHPMRNSAPRPPGCRRPPRHHRHATHGDQLQRALGAPHGWADLTGVSCRAGPRCLGLLDRWPGSRAQEGCDCGLKSARDVVYYFLKFLPRLNNS